MLHVTPGLLEQAPVSVVTAEPGAKFVLIPDAALLFKADFHRAGPDLVLTGEDGHRTLVQDYFRTDAPLPLMAPNGAALQPDVIDLLAGSPAANQYAQAGAAAQPAAAIGSVKTLIGNVSVIRNGVEVTLRVGDPVYKSDVVQTASGSAVGISFPDGTALHLTASARMAMTDYSFDAGNAAGNGALFTLVEGTFSFVAGQVAKGGVGMKIGTPVATMAIRGTTGWVQQVATINVNVGNVSYSFAVTNDQGTNVSGIYDLTDSAGNVIATVSEKGVLTFITGQGPGQTPLVATQQMTAEQLTFEQQIVQAVFNAVGVQGIIPRSDQGSGSQPPLPNFIPQNYQYTPGDQPTTTFTVNVPGAPAPASVTIVQTPPPPANHSPTLDNATLPAGRANNGGQGQTVAAIFAGKFHDADANAQLAGIAVAGVAGNTPNDQGTWQYSIDGGTTWIDIAATSMSATAALVLTADTLLRFDPASNFYGVVPSLIVYAIDNTFTGLTTGAVINASGGGGNSPISGSPTEISTSVQANVWIAPGTDQWGEDENWSDGTPAAGDVVVINLPSGQKVQFASGEIAALENMGGGTVEISGCDARLTIGDPDVDDSGRVINHGKIKVLDGADLVIKNAIRVDNVTGARMEADGCGSLLKFSDSFVTNAGLIQARDDGEVRFTYGTEVHNDGTIAAKSGGEVVFWGGTVDNTLGVSGNGHIKAIGCDSIVEFYDTVVIGGTLQTGNGGLIVVSSGGEVSNESTVFDGTKCDAPVTIDGDVLIEGDATLTLKGTIVIRDEATFDSDCGDGLVKLDGASIVGDECSDCNTLTNYTEIAGFGEIGNGCDSDLTLVNEGGIVANDECGTLTIDTGSNDVENSGMMLAENGGRLVIYSNVDNECGTIQVDCGSYVRLAGDVCGGEVVINGGTLRYDGQSTAATAFECGDGTLELGSTACVQEIQGLISGANGGDVFRFLEIDSCDVYWEFNECDDTLTVSDSDTTVILHLTDGYTAANFCEGDNNGAFQLTVHDL